MTVSSLLQFFVCEVSVEAQLSQRLAVSSAGWSIWENTRRAMSLVGQMWRNYVILSISAGTFEASPASFGGGISGIFLCLLSDESPRPRVLSSR